jgi:hypothetical protein
MAKKLLFSVLIMATVLSCMAQENYEIQVYSSPTMPKNSTIFELHSNYTLHGKKESDEGVFPNYQAFHETVEITHGFTPWFEIGAYLFTAVQPGLGWQFIGSHIRPRVMLPESYGLPVGLSLSIETGYQRREYATDTWSTEIRPIIDKTIGNYYLSLNPTMELSHQGLNKNNGLALSPNFKASYKVNESYSLGVEYYGGIGTFKQIDPIQDQDHQLFAVFDLLSFPDYELNIGLGKGITAANDNVVLKVLIGRRIKH